MRRSIAARTTVLAAGALLFLPAAGLRLASAQIPMPVTSDAESGERMLHLEVFINGGSTGLIGAFRLRADGGLLADPDELRNIGLEPKDVAIDPEGLVRLDRLPDVVSRLDEQAQRLYVTTDNDGRSARIVDVGAREKQDRPKSRSGYGGVLNYSLFASADTLSGDEAFRFDGVSGAFEARLFSPFGSVEQSFIASYVDGDVQPFRRLNTTWTYSDPDRLMTYRAGDFVSGGLSWTRPVYLGGVQVQRNFALRPDLVTVPLPAFAGTAAVPSTLEVYTRNVRTYSGEVPAGPFQIVNLPVFVGGGEARVVLRDALGRETTAALPFYTSDMLLRQGLLDFSAEIGFPRRDFGTQSDNYDETVMGVASARYGLTDWLTLEAHLEGGGDLINGGAGAAFPLGPFGAASLAVAGSNHDGATGALVNATVELSIDGWAFYGRFQRSFGDYRDIAAVTAETAPFVGGEFPVFSADVPRTLAQATLSVPLDFSTLNISYTHLDSGHGERSGIVGLSYTQTVFDRASFYLTAFVETEDRNDFGVFAGLSIPLGERITTSAGFEQTSSGSTYVVDIASPERPEHGSLGWRARFAEGETPNRTAAVSYRFPFARTEVGVQQHGDDLRASASLDGAIVVAGGDLFVTNRIDDAFAVVDAGEPGIAVHLQNRLVGKTNARGRIIVPGMNSYEPSKVSIDPSNLPVNADIPSVSETVVPAQGSGVVVDFGISTTADAAIVVLLDADGLPLQAGLAGRTEDGARAFVVGYDGRTYITGLGPSNSILVAKEDGSECRARFAYRPASDRQIVIEDVPCL